MNKDLRFLLYSSKCNFVYCERPENIYFIITSYFSNISFKEDNGMK